MKQPLAIGFLLSVALTIAPPLALGLDNASLTGTYHFVHTRATIGNGQVTGGANMAGTVAFDGAGGFTLGGGASGAGSYTVTELGEVALDSVMVPGLSIDARVSGDLEVVIGSTTDSAGTSIDLYIAVKLGGGASNRTLMGTYTGSTFGVPDSDPTAIHSSLVSFRSGGTGVLPTVDVAGHVLGGPINVTQSAAGATYSIGGDGTGTASFGTGATLLSGDRVICVSSDGTYFLAYSPSGQSDIFFAARTHDTGGRAFTGRYWIAELGFDGFDYSSASGAVFPDTPADGPDSGVALVSQRINLTPDEIDFSGLNFWAHSEDGSGWLANRPLTGVTNMGLLATREDLSAGAFAGAQVGAGEVGDPSSDTVGMFVGVRAPEFELAGLDVDPRGVVNGASFALLPHPVSPGSIVTVFGVGFTPVLGPSELAATALPLPTTLAGLDVDVNGSPAGLFFSSTQQVNAHVPTDASGDTATFTVTNGGATDSVGVRLASTSPGIFSVLRPESIYSAIVQKADGSIVSASNPATSGEAVVIYCTGLGTLDPPVGTGMPNPGLSGEGVSSTSDTDIIVYFNTFPAQVLFAGGTPGFAGLYQVNAIVPSGIPTNRNTPLAISTSNAFHDQVDVAITGGAAATAAPTRGISSGRNRIAPRARVSY